MGGLRYLIRADGSSRDREETAGIGVTVLDQLSKAGVSEIMTISEWVPHIPQIGSVVAEMTAIARALQIASDLLKRSKRYTVLVISDAKFIVNQINARNLRSDHPVCTKILGVIQQILKEQGRSITLKFEPRGDQLRPDALARQASATNGKTIACAFISLGIISPKEIMEDMRWAAETLRLREDFPESYVFPITHDESTVDFDGAVKFLASAKEWDVEAVKRTVIRLHGVSGKIAEELYGLVESWKERCVGGRIYFDELISLLFCQMRMIRYGYSAPQCNPAGGAGQIGSTAFYSLRVTAAEARNILWLHKRYGYTPMEGVPIVLSSSTLTDVLTSTKLLCNSGNKPNALKLNKRLLSCTSIEVVAADGQVTDRVGLAQPNTTRKDIHWSEDLERQLRDVQAQEDAGKETVAATAQGIPKAEVSDTGIWTLRLNSAQANLLRGSRKLRTEVEHIASITQAQSVLGEKLFDQLVESGHLVLLHGGAVGTDHAVFDKTQFEVYSKRKIRELDGPRLAHSEGEIASGKFWKNRIREAIGKSRMQPVAKKSKPATKVASVWLTASCGCGDTVLIPENVYSKATVTCSSCSQMFISK